MLISERVQDTLAGRGTNAQTVTVLCVSLICAQYSSAMVSAAGSYPSRGKGMASASSFEWQVSEPQLLGQISRVYEALLSNQVVLDEEASRILYSNLWDIYS